MRAGVALIAMTVVACVAAPEPPVDHASFEDVRRVVNALDDVAGDYPDAVADGAVIAPVRVRVLERLLHEATRYAEHLTGTDRSELAALVADVGRRAPAVEVVAAARRLRAAMLAREQRRRVDRGSCPRRR